MRLDRRGGSAALGVNHQHLAVVVAHVNRALVRVDAVHHAQAAVERVCGGSRAQVDAGDRAVVRARVQSVADQVHGAHTVLVHREGVQRGILSFGRVRQRRCARHLLPRSSDPGAPRAHVRTQPFIKRKNLKRVWTRTIFCGSTPVPHKLEQDESRQEQNIVGQTNRGRTAMEVGQPNPDPAMTLPPPPPPPPPTPAAGGIFGGQAAAAGSALPWSPAPRLTVGRLKGLHWTVIPDHLLGPTLWNQAPVSDWRELDWSDFDDLDASWRQGGGVAHPLASPMPSAQLSLIDVRRTQNIEIMLRRIPGAATADKAAFAAHVLGQMLQMRACELQDALLAMRLQVRAATGKGVSPAHDVVQKMRPHPPNSVLSVLGSDIMGAILARQHVMHALRFAETSWQSFWVVNGDPGFWLAYWHRLMPPPVAASFNFSAPCAATAASVLTAVEIMLENSRLLAPLGDEITALSWYAGDRSRLSSSNIFLMQIGASPEFQSIRAVLGCDALRDLAPVLELHLKSMRILFKADAMADCFVQARAGVRRVLESEALVTILMAVRAIGNRLNNSNEAAFALRSLLALKDVPCNGNKGTLLQYLAAFLSRRAPSALSILDHLSELETTVETLLRIEHTVTRLLQCSNIVGLWSQLRSVVPDYVHTSRAPLAEEVVALRTSFETNLLPLCLQCEIYFGATPADTMRSTQTYTHTLTGVTQALSSTRDILVTSLCSAKPHMQPRFPLFCFLHYS